MDWVFREYSNPFSLLESLIQNNRFNNWIDVFLTSHNQKIQWEFWLHKDFEHTWNEFVGEDSQDDGQSMTDEQMISTVQDTYAILNGFKLEEGDE